MPPSLGGVAARGRRYLMRLSLVLVLALTACGGPGPAPTPDPFSGLGERAEEAFQEGLGAFEQGRFRDALASFERARLLSPTQDPRIEQMIERSRTLLTPTPTPGPPTATPIPATATPTPVLMSRATPDSELGARYFGQVFLTVVPGRNVVPPPLNEFFYEDQIGLYVEALEQRLRLPFTLRVFDLDSGRVVANVRSEGALPTPGPEGFRGPGGSTAPGARTGGAAPAVAAATPTPSDLTSPAVQGTRGPGDYKIVRFWNNFVWYHEGGEAPGRYRAELYSNGTITHAFDYVVGNVPVALPVFVPSEPAGPELARPVLPGIAGTGLPEAEPGAVMPPALDRPAAPPAQAAPAAPAAPAPPPPPPTPTPAPTFTPTPAPAAQALVGGLPAGLDVNAKTDRVYIADASGVVRTVDRNQLTYEKPFTLDRLPVDVAVDQTTGNLYVSGRSAPGIVILNGVTGQRLASVPLPVNPGEIQLDSELGLLHVVLAERQAISTIDVRAGRIIRSATNFPQVSGLALDRESHLLYASHLNGDLSVLDGRTGQLINRLSVSGAGLSGVAAAQGQAYAINTATRELIVVDQEGGVSKLPLPDEPAAIAAGQESGTVYVLGTLTNAIIRIDPATGDEVGRVLLSDRSGQFGMAPQQTRDMQGLRARIVLNQADETVYVTQPESGTLSVAPPVLFPPLAQDTAAAPVAAAPVPVRPTSAPVAAARQTTMSVYSRPAAAPVSRPAQPAQAPTPTTTTVLLAGARPGTAASQPRPTPHPRPSGPPPAAAAPTKPPAATPTPAPAPHVELLAQPARGEIDVLSISTDGSAALGGPRLEWSVEAGRFFTQTNGQPAGASTRGFAMSDAAGVSFWSAYQELGGTDALGYPTSHRFHWRGHPVQLTQRVLLQWAPDGQGVRLANLLDELHDVGLDERLLSERLIPKQMSYQGEAGLSFEQVKARRLALLEADPALKARYFASPDPLLEFGLPTSRVVDLGLAVAVRTQRGALQRWKHAMPWAQAGEVTAVIAGDLARDYRLFGPSPAPFAPAEAPNAVGQARWAALRKEQI